jgi:4-amino-4-deoxy-L-arabinose transferase-like glycosyltransferase
MARTGRELAHQPRAWFVVLAFLLRLAWVLAVPSRPVGDFALYREAAEYLLDQGRLDDEFVYMPGYVMVLAAVRALGGELLAYKVVGVVAGTLAVFAAGGIAGALFGRRAGIIATALMALWPAGIAAASVTGTDMPAGALGALAVHALVAGDGQRERAWRAAALSGMIFGLAAWVRAVAAPLAGLSLLYWLARGVRWPVALARTAVAVAIAFLVLLPWGLRNQKVYGELFFTDSHGGHTALVGANPNTEGTYSRSLNLMFTKGTGYRLFEPPARHRQSDRVAYQLAKDWTAFEPAYAVGLLIAKADRLLTREKNLLYWPVFRQGVLDGDHSVFFHAHRLALERITDLFWWVVAGLAAAGVALCAHERGPRWADVAGRADRAGRAALAILVFPVALMAIYSLFFAEVRYHLAIAPLLIPYAAFALDSVWVAAATARRGAGRKQAAPPRSALASALPSSSPFRPRRWWRPALSAAAATLLLFAGWAVLLPFGERLRARHRWAVSVCAYPAADRTHLCLWRRASVAHGEQVTGDPAIGNSPLRGTWDGVGLHVNPSPSTGGPGSEGFTGKDGVLASARTELAVGPGRFRVSALVSLTGRAAVHAGLAAALRANGRVIARTLSPKASALGQREPGVSAAPLNGVVELTNSDLVLEIDVEPAGIGSTAEGTVWVSQVLVERF